MKSFKTLILTFMLLGINTLYATGTELAGGASISTLEPETDNIMNNALSNDLGATDISDLSGVDCCGREIEKFIIYSLPTAEEGILYLGDGTTAVLVDQVITLEEARALQFDPASGYVGEATFTYSSIDSTEEIDLSPATVTIPIVNGMASTLPTADNKNNAPITNTSDAVNISDLSGEDADCNAVNNFIITSLPLATQGVLYMADGVTAITLNQALTLEEANGLRFDPTAGYVGDVTFTYVAVDGNNARSNPATVTIPVEDAVGGGETLPTADNKNNAPITNTSDAVNISDLSGEDAEGNAVNNFIITSLPLATQGVLYMADGVTAITLNQALTLEEANGLRFNPTAGYVGDVTFTYVAVDGNNARSNPATVTIPVEDAVGGGGNLPTADDKRNPAMANTLGAVNILNLSGVDAAGNAINNFVITSLPSANQGVLYMADGVTAITLNQALTLEEANGLRFDPTAGYVGNVTFTYVAVDANTIRSNPATVTIPLVSARNQSIIVHDDVGIATGGANPITIDVLANDRGIPAGSRVWLVDSNGSMTDRIVVQGEGIWTVNEDNTITFTPVAPFVGTPSPIHYLVQDLKGGVSNIGTIIVKGTCVCKAYETSIDSLNSFGLLVMLLFSTLLGMRFTKKLA